MIDGFAVNDPGEHWASTRPGGGHILGTMASGSSQERMEPVVEGVRALLRHGLPARPGQAPEALLALPNVKAHATVAGDELARIDALDRLVRRELWRLGLSVLRKPAAALFGASGHGGSLTDRRRAAARLAGYQDDHFRKRIEPKIIEQVAWQLYQGSLQFANRRHGPEPIAASGEMPTISAEHVEQTKTAEHEVLVSRIWSEVYGLRAELIAREATRDDPERQDEFAEAATGALWYLARLLRRLDTYLERYGRTILHGAAEYDADALIRLAGWNGELSQEEARELRFALARAGEWDREAFRAQVAGSGVPSGPTTPNPARSRP